MTVPTSSSDTVGGGDDDLTPNAKQTNVGGDFPHMFDISNEMQKMEKQARVLVFTDKEQDTPAVAGVTAATFVNAPVADDQTGEGVNQIVSLGESSDDGASFPGTFDDDTADKNPAIEGTFTCTGTRAYWFIRAAGTISWSRRCDRLHVFRKKGRR